MTFRNFCIAIFLLGILGWGFFSIPLKKIDTISPKPKLENFSGELQEVSFKTDIGKDFKNQYQAFFNWIEKDLNQWEGIENELTIEIYNKGSLRESYENYFNKHDDVYLIERKANQVLIVGKDSLSVLNGFVTLKKFLQKNKGKLQNGYILDWPDHSVRGFHFVSRNVKPEKALELLYEARFYNYNTLFVQLADGVKLNSMEGQNLRTAWDKEFLADFVKLSKELGFKFIPDLNLLSHQEKLFRNKYPKLMYNRYTYNPQHPETKKKVKEIIDEVIDLINPNAVHIGHDEILGVYERHPNSNMDIKDGEEPLPSELFKESILFLHDYLSSKDIEMWMWGDMFLDRNEYPQMFKWSNHGNDEYAALVNEIPNDIIICDWHYFDNQKDFPTADFFLKKGFKTVGATWKKEKTVENFSRYMNQFDRHKRGMMATTWFHVQREEWDIVNDVLIKSSKFFWNAE